MRFEPTRIPGAYVIHAEPIEDERGFFARTWCEREFREHGLDPGLRQCSVSVNRRRGTLRGMHYQAAPHEEAKLVRVSRGAVYDVVLDLRPGSATRLEWLAEELTAENHRMLYVPEGCAHGFQSLEDDTEVVYHISTTYHPESARGVRWDDPAFGIVWPRGPRVLSERDAAYPDYDG